MTDNGVVTAGGRLTDQISLGVLASSVPRDAVDDTVAAAGRQARRRDGKPAPHVMVYFAMAMALFADDDYEEVAARLAGNLPGSDCWDGSWSVPTSGGSECGAHAVVDAEIGGVAGKGAGEQAPARRLYSRLDAEWLLIADRNFTTGRTGAPPLTPGAALLGRVKSDLRLPVLETLPDGSSGRC